MKKFKFIGSFSIETKNGQDYFVFENKEDLVTLRLLVRNIYKFKTHKKRINKKYMKKFINDSLASYIVRLHQDYTNNLLPTV